MEEFFEYAVRIERPNHRIQIIEYRRSHADAKAYRDYEAEQWGDDKVHILTRLVKRTEWQEATNIPMVPQPPAPPDSGGECSPEWEKPSASPTTGFTDVPTGWLL